VTARAAETTEEHSRGVPILAWVPDVVRHVEQNSCVLEDLGGRDSGASGETTTEEIHSGNGSVPSTPAAAGCVRLVFEVRDVHIPTGHPVNGFAVVVQVDMRLSGEVGPVCRQDRLARVGHDHALRDERPRDNTAAVEVAAGLSRCRPPAADAATLVLVDLGR
jgi:hypothetical protein